MNRRQKGIGGLLGAIAASLAVMSGLHLGGVVHGGSGPYTPSKAGIAEAVIAGVLALAAGAQFRAHLRGRAIGLGATGFAIAGFIVGLSISASGGPAVDIAYHATILPILVIALGLQLRR